MCHFAAGWIGTGFFTCGTAFGILLTLGAAHAPTIGAGDGSGGNLDSAPRVELVSGDDARTEVRTPSLPVPSFETQAGRGQQDVEELAPQRIAARARAMSAFVRGGGGGYGSGIMISPAGYVLTCWHVVSAAGKPRVTLSEGPEYSARVVEHDEQLDLAVLKLESSVDLSSVLATAWKAGHLGSIVDTRVGDEVFAMGAPYRMAFSFGRGMVSFVGRTFDGVHFLQTDVPTNAGHSGGAILNWHGEVVAVSSFILKESEGLAFALPIDYAYQRFSKYFLGVPPSSAFEDWLLARAQAGFGPSTSASPQ